MIGVYNLRVENKKVRYDFRLDHKFTVVRGNSATGKTYFRDILNEQGTKIYCSLKVSALDLEEEDYRIKLTNSSGRIFIIDEDVEGYHTKKFADLLQDSDNYFILFCRDILGTLPISTDSIYELRSETFYNNLNVPFTVTTLSKQYLDKKSNVVVPDLVITEDSKSGYQFSCFQ